MRLQNIFSVKIIFYFEKKLLCLLYNQTLMNKATEIKDVRDEIAAHLKENGIMQKWLAKKINISDPHLSLILRKERELTDENKEAINALLGTSF